MAETQRLELFDKCRQAWMMKRTFAKADAEVLSKELSGLHERCPGTLKILSKGVRVDCTCECHRVTAARKGR